MAKKFKRFESINTLLKYLRPYRRGFIISIVMLVVTCAAMVTSPNVEGMITNSILKDVTDIAKGVPGFSFPHGKCHKNYHFTSIYICC